MSFLSSHSKETAWIRIDHDRIDAVVGAETFSCAHGLNQRDGFAELTDWLAQQSHAKCHVMICTRCCFVCEFELTGSSASDTAIRFAAEASLPLAVEEMAAVYFQNGNRVLFVAVRKELVSQLQLSGFSIETVVPESLFLSSSFVTKTKARKDVVINSPSGAEHIVWNQQPVCWAIADGEAGHAAFHVMCDGGGADTGIGSSSTESLSWTPEEGLELAKAAYAKMSRSLLGHMNLLSDPTLSSHHLDSQYASFVSISQIVFGCCLVLICALLYRQGQLDQLTYDVSQRRSKLVSMIFEKTSKRVSDRKLLSELKLRRSRQQAADEWLSSQPDSRSLFTNVIAACAAEANVNVVSIDCFSGGAEVNCQVQTDDRVSQLVTSLIDSQFDVEILSKRPANGLLTLQLMLTPFSGAAE